MMKYKTNPVLTWPFHKGNDKTLTKYNSEMGRMRYYLVIITAVGKKGFYA